MSGAQSIGSEPFGLNLFVPQYAFEGTMPMVASVMTAALTSAEYYVTCAPEAEECGLGPGATVTMAPGTYGIDIEYPGFTMSLGCEIEHYTATCTQKIDGEDANSPGTETETMADVDTDIFFRDVTVTAGFEALMAATSGPGGSGPVTATATTQSGGDGGDSKITPAPTGTQASDSGDAPAGAAEETSPSTAAAPRATRDAVVAGVAALMGWAFYM